MQLTQPTPRRGAGRRPTSARPGGAAVLAGVALTLLAARPARGDGSLTLRGAYYKERATRVVQPMVDGAFQVGDHGAADGHLLVDAITSASSSSGAADTAFTERRYEAGGGYGHELSWGKLRGDVRVSREPDYFSLFGVGGVELAFAEKNTIVALSGGGGSDQVSNAGAQGPFAAKIEDSLRTVLGSASVSQLLSPELVVSAGYDLSHLRGYQQNPYRMVLIGASAVPEQHPDTRTRHALAATGKWFRPCSETALIGSYRFYVDSWGVLAHTPELRVVQQLSDDLEAAVRYRFHWQRAADFFERAYNEQERYVTDDEKLSGFTSHTLEAKVALIGEALGLKGAWAEARGELLFSYIIQDNRFGNAVAAQAALTLPFSY